MPITPPPVPKPSIGGKPSSSRPTIGGKTQDRPTQDWRAIIRNPETGDEKEFTMQNARDLINHHGWVMVREIGTPRARLADMQQAKIEGKIRDLTTPSDDDAGEAETTAKPRERTELDDLRDEYKARADVDPDQRWGIRRLRDELAKIEELGAQTENTDAPSVDEVDTEA